MAAGHVAGTLQGRVRLFVFTGGSWQNVLFPVRPPALGVPQQPYRHRQPRGQQRRIGFISVPVDGGDFFPGVSPASPISLFTRRLTTSISTRFSPRRTAREIPTRKGGFRRLVSRCPLTVTLSGSLTVPKRIRRPCRAWRPEVRPASRGYVPPGVAMAA